MFKIALLGRDISYSMSPRVHAVISESSGVSYKFDMFDVKYDELTATANYLLDNYDGFFVTRPYKQNIKRLLTQDGGSINVVRSRDKAVFDTDGLGFISALDRNFSGWRETVANVLVLGAGGASRSVCTALSAVGKKIYILDRTIMNAARLVSEYKNGSVALFSNQEVELAVNCTSVGMSGEDILKSLCVLPDFKYAFDLIYSCDTPFLRRARAGGAETSSGTDMLIYQAIEGIKLITGSSFDTETVFESVKEGL